MTQPRRPSGYAQPPDWKRTMRRIIRRDLGTCYLCGKPGADTVDHVQPVAEGGTHNDDNLKAAHRHPCHARKTERERLRGIARRSPRRKPRPNPNLIDPNRRRPA